MKRFGQLLVLVGIIGLFAYMINGIRSDYEYEETVYSYWQLSHKSSTLEKKSENLDIFVNKLSELGLEGKHDAIIFETKNNSFDENMITLKSLQDRLVQIKNMDVSSFAYQTAILQITEQEQGHASSMLGVLDGVWYKEYHFMLWGWVCFVGVSVCIVLVVVGAFIWDAEANSW